MAVSATYLLKCLAAETIALGLDNVDDPTVNHDIGTVTGTLDATSTVPATKSASDTVALAAGAATLDLTSLPGPSSTTVTFDGLKVQALIITCPATNSGGVTFAVHAANGYNLFGADNASAEQVEVLPGGAEARFTPNNGEDVDATHKQVAVTGTGTDGFSYVLVAG